MGDVKNLNVTIWAERIRNSDKKAYKLLYEHLWDTMAMYSASIVDNDDVAKDILQDVWLDYWKRRERIKAQNIKAYLYSALRKNCYKYLRDNKLTSLQEEVIESVEYNENGISSEENNATRTRQLNESLESLPNRCREIFLLSRINGLSNEDIAKSFDISKKTVENQISSALRRLRKDLGSISSLLSSLFW